jgi:hypothetical protein
MVNPVKRKQGDVKINASLYSSHKIFAQINTDKKDEHGYVNSKTKPEICVYASMNSAQVCG